MARQSKKIAKKIQPKTAAKTESTTKNVKGGKDYLLIIMIVLTLLCLIVGWTHFTSANRGLYIALMISLSSTYARRHYNFTDTQDLWIERSGILSMIAAIIFFGLVVYQQYFN